MKKSQRFSNMHPDNGEEFERGLDGEILSEDLPYHTYKAGRSKSRAGRKSRRIQRRSSYDMQIDDGIGD